jgi:pimeloyl-ACP methyl ester carboxylesterase
VLNWRNNWQPPAIYHVHGDADRIFPISNLSPTFTIKGGGHFMIMNKAVEVNEALFKILSN